ncbi:hypothetical protein PGT21_013784 [Puccinia graminis f. sp. tritici]|uniref:Cyanovirin-N domain-containing protein n=1 Tax=Puccinia graminis f. sp. tritici TaxID=56615 RepID=A0A5B0LMC4_PUCGR|nr:hypothetical protein PGT21_013784 [Puccinia graminis f. sp. tritici]
MRFSSCFKFCLLILVQTQAISCDFKCNDGSKPNAKLGFCLRKRYASDGQDTTLPREKDGDYLMIQASPRGENFTCLNLRIGDKIIEERFCCDQPPSTKVIALTGNRLHNLCYSRGLVVINRKGPGRHVRRSI